MFSSKTSSIFIYRLFICSKSRTKIATPCCHLVENIAITQINIHKHSPLFSLPDSSHRNSHSEFGRSVPQKAVRKEGNFAPCVCSRYAYCVWWLMRTWGSIDCPAPCCEVSPWLPRRCCGGPHRDGGGTINGVLLLRYYTTQLLKVRMKPQGRL